MAPVARLMMPEPRYVTTTAIAIPAITAPAPTPSRAKRRMSFITYQVAKRARMIKPAKSARRHPSVGRRVVVAGLLPPVRAVVLVELGVVVADARSLRVLAAVELGRAEDQRAPERLHL